MKLRTHLVVLVLAAVLPVLAFSAVMGVVFWRQQRAAYDQRYLERVRALAIALDRELDGHLRALQVMSESIPLQIGDFATFYEQAKRMKAQQPAWATVSLTEPTGATIFNLRRPFGTPLPKTGLDEELLRKVVTTGQPIVSPLYVGTVGGTPTTAVAVPVRRADTTSLVLVVSLEPRVWLDLFARYPLVPGATITLLDQRGVIVTRTLNHDRWVGKPPSAGLTHEVLRAPENAYRNVGLEGQLFYAAHSRSAVSGWTVATGVPAETVEATLRESAIALTAGVTLVAVLAVALAYLVGGRIARPVTALARSVARFGEGQPPAPLPGRAVDEVAEVSRAFEDAAARLSARESALRDLAAERATLLDNERVARAEAETANRMKDEFLAVLSHELRTPINAVYGWAKILRGGVAGGQSHEHGLEVIERNAAAQVRLIEDLLDISRIVTGKMRLDVRDVDIAAAVNGAVDSVRHAAQMKEITLVATVEPGAGPVTGDADRLQQVVWNLLSNAIKFTPKGGRVEVSAARDHSRVKIVVTDTGIGMAPDLLPHVFDRFRQGDSTSTRRYGGLGLGLALVRHIVELHGGTAYAASGGDGEGARFTVELPISPIVRPAMRPGRPAVDSAVDEKGR